VLCSLIRQALGKLVGLWSRRLGRVWVAALLLSPDGRLGRVLVLQADAQSAAARWSGGRDIHVFLEPVVKAPEAQRLQGEAARAEGVRSARVATLTVPVGFASSSDRLATRCCPVTASRTPPSTSMS
jgi:hypothetical protein